jgi:hypothetical protein
VQTPLDVSGKQDAAFLPRLFQGIRQISMDTTLHIPLTEN